MRPSATISTSLEFRIKVLGRTLEHLGAQMYKRRDIAIAELVANSWDAGAQEVRILAPTQDTYNQNKSKIIITDDGLGMDKLGVQNAYLVVGRNRREAGSGIVLNRPVMGRKGIGKLAGFGLATRITVETWRDSECIKFILDMPTLKVEDGQAGDIPIMGHISLPPSDVDKPSGTRITLEGLKHSTPLSIEGLTQALGRRFSRRILGEMTIYVNHMPVGDPYIEIEQRFPHDGYDTATLPDGSVVKYYYAYAQTVIQSAELRGFTVLVRGKTAQAPPYFFGVEATASGQHGTKYLTGVIEADFLDEGNDDESDIISTDRQEIDWEQEEVINLKRWGGGITRKALRDWATRKGEQVENEVLKNPELKERIGRLDDVSKKRILTFVRQLGGSGSDPERTAPLADLVIRAFEYRHFHDVIEQIENVSEDPLQLQNLLEHLRDWKVLESRAILEIINGRLNVIQKFHSMIVNNAPETASSLSKDNMHDILAGYPWLLNPEWQVLAEEKTISKQLREWNAAEIINEEEKLRYDFLALSDDSTFVIVEIKRSDHALTLEELQRLEKYKERLRKARNSVRMMMVCGGTYDVSAEYLENWSKRSDGDIVTWSEIYERTLKYYLHFRAVLEGDIFNPHFTNKVREVAQSRRILDTSGSYRSSEERRLGIGPQDTSSSA